jgi:hypothetical protein
MAAFANLAEGNLIPPLAPPPPERPKTAAATAIEANTSAAACVFAYAVGVDALSSLPTTAVADVPTSLRVTALVLVAMLGAPPVDPDLFFEQRGLTFLLLMCAAVFGLHEQELYPRIADAIYSLVGGWAIVVAYARAAPKVEERGYDGKGQRENMAALAAALLAYAGARVVRAGATHAGTVVGFSESHENFSTRGYAMADDVVASALVFGGVACVGAAVVVFLNHDAIYEHGCAPVSNVLGMLSVLVFSGAFVAQVIFYARVDELSAIFGENSCDGSPDVCSASIRARRLHVANATPATLWACAVGLVLFAFPHARRCRSRSLYFRGCKDDYEYEEGRAAVAAASNATGWTAVFASLIALVVVVAISDHTATLAAVEVLLLYGSIPLAWFGAAWLATAVHFAGLAMHVVHKTGTIYGFDLSYLTHWTVLLTLVLLAVLTVTMLIAFLLYDSRCSRDRVADCVDIITAHSIAALTSIQLVLTLASLGVCAAYDGGRVFLGSNSWLAFGMQWSTQHCLSFFFAAALVGARYECWLPEVSSRWLKVWWFTTPVLVLAAWVIALLAKQDAVPYEQVADPLALVVATLGALVPWGVIGYYLC